MNHTTLIRDVPRLRRTCIGLLAILWSALSASCLVDSPLLDDPAVQGDYEDGDAEHRPGQPCLICHGPGHVPRPPGEVQFQIAGTVFGAIDDPEDQGVAGVEVIVTDANGVVTTVESNRVGNFMVSVNEGASEPRVRERGWLAIPRALAFPLGVTIRRDTDEQIMRTKIWRAGSCAHCHGTAPDTDSVGRVYLFSGEAP